MSSESVTVVVRLSDGEDYCLQLDDVTAGTIASWLWYRLWRAPAFPFTERQLLDRWRQILIETK